MVGGDWDREASSGGVAFHLFCPLGFARSAMARSSSWLIPRWMEREDGRCSSTAEEGSSLAFGGIGRGRGLSGRR